MSDPSRVPASRHPMALSAPERWTGSTASPSETRALAARLAAVAGPGDRIGLVGNLGAGKTEFARGFARGLGWSGVVNSPSFTLMQEYEGRLRLFHIDVYRLAGVEDALAGGLLDEREQEGVSLVEWADRLPGPVGAFDLEIRLEPEGEGDDRDVELVAHTPRGIPYVQAAREVER
jgi:tRNA threonylcarbamoyladenosine biosynthesis protein TsaE